MSDLDLSAEQILREPSAGRLAIRGSALRGGGYLAGWILLAVASVLLVRHLGVADFGRYATVMSIVAVVSALGDPGLSLLGQRDIVQTGGAVAGARRRLLEDILGIRLLLTPLTIGLAVVFAWAVGYTQAMVLGVFLAGSALILAGVNSTLMIPLIARLRIGTVTTADLISDMTVVGGIALLVVAGASLAPFFAIHIVAAAAACVFLVVAIGRHAVPRPRLSWREWGPIVGEAVPMGIASTINVVYYRALLVTCSLAATAHQTGLFATSFRIVEVVLAVSARFSGPFFPIIAHAGKHDEERLRYALQRMFEVTLLLAFGFVLLLTIGGPALIRLLGGEEFKDAGPVLQIQAFALIGALTGAVWFAGVVAVRRQSALILRNGVVLVLILVLGVILIPHYGAKGAAAGAVVGETLLSIGGLILLLRARPGLRFQVAFCWRLLVAGGIAALCVLIPAPGLVRALAALVVYGVLAVTLRAVPPEVFDAFRLARGGSQ